MKLTNKHNVSEVFVTAVENDTYSKGDAHISVTGLLSPPQMRHLLEKHDDEIEVDVSDRLAALHGQAMHVVAERAASGNLQLLTEKTIYTHYLGWKIKGQFDGVLIGPGILRDLKNCKAYKVADGKIPEEWVQQTNIYKRMLQKEKGLVINQIHVDVFIRDFSERKARTTAGYPPSPGYKIDIPVWDDDTIDAFIEERVRLHQEAEPRPCSEKDIWAKPAKWAVMKRGNMRAVKLFDNPEEAAQFASSSVAFHVEHRPGEATRCMDYCAAARFCSQWAADPRNIPTTPSIMESLFDAQV